MALQVVHTEKRPIRASSLYCCWIRVPGENGALRAIWIDSEMRPFEQQMAGATSEGALVDEPGGARRCSKEEGEPDAIELYRGS